MIDAKPLYPIGTLLRRVVDEPFFFGTETMRATCEYEVVAFRPSIMTKGRWIYELQEVGVPRTWPFCPHQHEVENTNIFEKIK